MQHSKGTSLSKTSTEPLNNIVLIVLALSCLLQLVGRWRRVTSYPLHVAEAQGGMIGNTTFLLVGGFKDSFNATAREAYSLDTSNEAAGWTRHNDMPSRVGITHAGFAVVNGTKFYMCGGYVGGTPGRHTHRCLVLDPSRPAGKQWSSFRSLPGGGRGGGGMVYDSTLEALIFAGGAQRPVANSYVTVDYNNTWMYSLRSAAPGARWIPKAALSWQPH
jgi:hypothetical protein